MLDAFVIEELRRREEAERGQRERPHLELPLEELPWGAPKTKEDPNSPHKGDRGVIVIDY
ncbi:MAG: hypothetical protein EOO40_09060 [Deltaproteobacteria bacterium]|nr:MAG: hypothetical protein EOO40_09060 [Deltaproteobacteria bacterium]